MFLLGWMHRGRALAFCPSGLGLNPMAFLSLVDSNSIHAGRQVYSYNRVLIFYLVIKAS